LGERGIIMCPHCNEPELCCWPDERHDHRCDKDDVQYPYDGNGVIELFPENVWPEEDDARDGVPP
jgi:hypothetical protein